MAITITLTGDSYRIKTPYDAKFVEALKGAIPPRNRKFDPASKAWIVAVTYGPIVQKLIAQCYSQTVDLPLTITVSVQRDKQVYEMHYLGLIKDRDDDSRSAYGYSHGDWNLVFPEDVLRDWFKREPVKSNQPSTLYSVLAVDSTVTADEIKAAYRRLAKQWHPDVCREPNAHERFIEIKNAYDVLADETRRAKYNAALKLLAQTGRPPKREYREFQSPLRCGLVMVSGQMKIGRLHVNQIHEWLDVTDARGYILVSSWPRGADHFIEQWVTP